MSMTWHDMNFILKRLNAGICMFPAKTTHSSMIYLRQPGHPYCNEAGYVEMCAFPSPQFYPRIPKYDFYTEKGQLIRGYTSIFRILCRKKAIKKDLLTLLRPDALEDSLKPPPPKPLEEKDRSQVPVHVLPTKQVGTITISRR